MKILVIALSGIGDALLFTPALQKLRQASPNSKIDLLVMFKGVKDIYEKLPYVNQIFFHDFINETKFKSLLFVYSLRKKYDYTINVYPSNRKEYNLISRIIGAKHRFAIKYLRKDFINLGFLNNVRILENDSLHNVEENFLMVEKLLQEKFDSIPSLQIELDSTDLIYAKDFLTEMQIQKDDLVVGFHPGCNTLKNHDKRRWDTKKFGELAKKIIHNYDAKILLFGGQEENKLKDEIKSIANHKNVISVNTFSLSNTAAVMKRCDVFITNDSSLMHVAAALKLNIISIIGPTNLNYIYPWQTKFKVASLNLNCSPCFYYSPKPLTCNRKDVKFKCIKELSVDLVFDKFEDVIEENFTLKS
ncbi:MAG: glycosyltransferase family 9 protein [Melioribacteraceae bacterium]|nr:glycosyltransferase family 9 protein [Melioribacteraceae bacterium]